MKTQFDLTVRFNVVVEGEVSKAEMVSIALDEARSVMESFVIDRRKVVRDCTATVFTRSVKRPRTLKRVK